MGKIFESIKFPDSILFENCVLHNLGKINVICGKNNSGKTTVLKAITGEKTVSIILDEEKIQTIVDESTRGTNWDREISVAPSKSYTNILKEVASKKESWLEHELTSDFFRQTTHILRGSHYSLPPEIERLLSQQVSNLFYRVNTAKTIYLPPKRSLQLNSKIQTSEAVEDDGKGILNYLFYAKGQDNNDKDKIVYKEISEAFTKISSGYHFEIFADKNNWIHLYFKYKNKNWVLADKCGLGLQDLISILYFAIHPEHNIILIEEPESHLHPDMQRKLLYFLAEETDKQFFLTTHSNIFLNNAFVDKVFFTAFNEHITVSDKTQKASVLDDLGYSVADNLVSDLVILVEGPSDVGVIETFLVKMQLYSKYNVKILPLGGDIMDQIPLSVFGDKSSVVALIDKDPGSEHVRKKFKRNCRELGIKCFQTQRYAIENYFTLNALKSYFKSQIPDTITSILPNSRLSDQIGINVKNNNRKIAEIMELSDIEGTDLEGFFKHVNKMLEATQKPKKVESQAS